MVIQVDSTQDVALTGLCLACTREYLSETVPGHTICRAGRSSGLSEPRILAGEQSGIADAHRGDGKRFVVRADEKLALELEAAIPLR
jgi:hypothetical protein